MLAGLSNKIGPFALPGQFHEGVFAGLTIVGFQFGLGCYAVALNKIFYLQFGPFFDSMAYLNRLLDFQSISQLKGTISAILDISFQGTVVLPWLIFAPL